MWSPKVRAGKCTSPSGRLTPGVARLLSDSRTNVCSAPHDSPEPRRTINRRSVTRRLQSSRLCWRGCDASFRRFPAPSCCSRSSRQTVTRPPGRCRRTAVHFGGSSSHRTGSRPLPTPGRRACMQAAERSGASRRRVNRCGSRACQDRSTRSRHPRTSSPSLCSAVPSCDCSPAHRLARCGCSQNVADRFPSCRLRRWRSPGTSSPRR
jgi:hypothetical protein